MINGPECHARLARRDSTATPLSISSYGLPPDLIAKAVHRLGWIGICYACVWVAFYVINRQFQPPESRTPEMLAFFGRMTAMSVLLGGLLTAVAWSRRVPRELALDFGLVFEVIAALLISIAENSAGHPEGAVIYGLSSVAIWAAIFVMAVPTTLGKSLLATFATILMIPLGLAIDVLWMGFPSPPLGRWLILSLPPMVVALWAVALSRFIYELGAQVTKAREMGSYELVDMLGRGGMGEVWRARHRMLARGAAIKLIRPEALSGTGEAETLRRRFEREAQETAALQSPHTVSIFDYGVTDDGAFYYVMELLEGMDLETLVARFGPLPPARAAYLLRQACDSLAEAHARDLLHRDIKPRNIIACRLGLNCDFVKVVDFGLARHTRAGVDSRLTMEGAVAGTPAYLAPEVALGYAEIEPAADLYGLGCVGYWMLTGSLVFEESSVMAMAMAHVRSEPVPPSRRLGRPLPEDLERVVLTCLEKDPARRPHSAAELAERLDRCRFDEPWSAARAREWWDSHVPGGPVREVLAGC
jgi:hypothetical protein